jgi:hypothetical protein
MELIEWLRAQLAEDERMALACILDNGGGRWALDRQRAFSEPALADGGVRIISGWSGALPHIANWDPARVLTEVNTRRALLDLHAPRADQDHAGSTVCDHCHDLCHSRSGLGCDSPDAPYPCETVSLYAQLYAGREGWQNEWSNT